MKRWLLSRLIQENPTFSPEFAFMGTVNWIHCLAISCPNQIETEVFPCIKSTEHNVNNSFSDTNRVFESLFMAQHSLVALNSISECVTFPSDISKVCVFAWSDCIINSAKAMLTCFTASCPADDQVNSWWFDFVESTSIIPYPFNIQVKNLTESNVDNFITKSRSGNTHTLNNVARDHEQAKGGLLSYLKGTANYYAEHEKENILISTYFQDNQLNNFRKKIAQEYRDDILSQCDVNFLSCVQRFKGKVLERDSIFLSYGKDQDEKISEMVSELNIIAKSFFFLAEKYCSTVIDKPEWRLFKSDLNENSRLTEIL